MRGVHRLAQRIRGMSPQLVWFLAGMAMLGVAGGIFETTFNNFIYDQFALTADQRGLLEFPRELPGFLTALFAGLLFFASETWIGGLSALAVGFGMLGLAQWGSQWSWMLVFMTLWSVGTHLIMPIRSSIGMELAGRAGRGRRLGQIHGVGIAASIAGCAVVWLAMKHLGAGYPLVFRVGGVASLIGAACLFAIRLPGVRLARPRFVWRREYRMYYLLALLFGARKQIFITFGPWVLVKVFGQPAWTIAQLWIAASVLGIAFQPALGHAIDRFGERRVLMVDALLIFAICMGYAFADRLPMRTAALWLLYACFVGDQLLFAVNIARDTYLSKIATRREDIAPTLSMGVTINHVVSMSVPFLGGTLWVYLNHSAVFIGAAAVALVMFLVSRRVRVPGGEQAFQNASATISK